MTIQLSIIDLTELRDGNFSPEMTKIFGLLGSRCMGLKGETRVLLAAQAKELA